MKTNVFKTVISFIVSFFSKKENKRKSLNESAELAYFTGTEKYHRFSKLFFNQMLTDGVHHIAEKYGLYWFLDVICSYQFELPYTGESFQVWTLERVKNTDAFKVIADDGNKNVLGIQDIEFSDFSEDHLKLYFADNVIMLPSEY